jgi:DNA-binding XRE family transcriptional regulator
MLHYCYIAFMLFLVSRPPKDETAPVVNRIEQARSDRGLSRGELADIVGVHYQTLGYLERGEYNPSLELALKICRALSSPMEEIFWLDDVNRIREADSAEIGESS